MGPRRLDLRVCGSRDRPSKAFHFSTHGWKIARGGRTKTVQPLGFISRRGACGDEGAASDAIWAGVGVMNPVGMCCRASRPTGRSALPGRWKADALGHHFGPGEAGTRAFDTETDGFGKHIRKRGCRRLRDWVDCGRANEDSKSRRRVWFAPAQGTAGRLRFWQRGHHHGSGQNACGKSRPAARARRLGRGVGADSARRAGPGLCRIEGLARGAGRVGRYRMALARHSSR